MNKPWFGRKIIGWGWGLPVRWQGWLVFILYITSAITSLTLHVSRKLEFFIFLLLTIIFIVIIRITSGKSQWGTWWGIKTNKRMTIIFGIFVAILIFIIIRQALFMEKAHVSFETYNAFRGCVELIEKTDTYVICKFSSGQTVKIVKYKNKWYLDGDLPNPFFNFL